MKRQCDSQLPDQEQSAKEKTVSFPLGDVVATPGAIREIFDSNQFPAEFLYRHASRDWGDLGEEDKQANDLALRTSGRLVSKYELKNGKDLYVITECDGSVTTLLLPEEY